MDHVQQADGTHAADNTLEITYGSGKLGDVPPFSTTTCRHPFAARGGNGSSSDSTSTCPKGTTLANLWLTQARMMGVPIRRFANSTAMVGVIVGVVNRFRKSSTTFIVAHDLQNRKRTYSMA